MVYYYQSPPPPSPTQPQSGSVTYVVPPPPPTPPTPAAASIGGQLATQLVGRATVTASGNSVTINARNGLPEATYDSLTFVLPVTQSVSITGSDIGTVQSNGTVRSLGRASSTATAILNRTFAAECATAQSDALKKGNNNCEVRVPKASSIDGIGSLFGPDGDTRGFEKQIFAMSFDTVGGAVVSDPGNSYQHNSHDFLGGGMGAYSHYSG
jgi:hypothetical protein